MKLTGKMIRALAEFAGYGMEAETEVEEDILECDISIDKTPDGKYIAYYSEYPEEGCIDLSDF